MNSETTLLNKFWCYSHETCDQLKDGAACVHPKVKFCAFLKSRQEESLVVSQSFTEFLALEESHHELLRQYSNV